MIATIVKICHEIEVQHKVRILFAIENGSRAWQLSSEDSDYDVRFVFARPLEAYVTINKPEEVISQSYDAEGNKIFLKGAIVDVVGFDVFKFAKMLSSSNPQAIEWLVSDIVYYGEQNKVFKKFATENFNTTSLFYHYLSMCRQNYLKYLKSGSNVSYKKYLYAMRGLLNAEWVRIKKTLPPVDFRRTINEMKNHIPAIIHVRLGEMIELKKLGKEKDIVENEVDIDEFIESVLKRNAEFATEKRISTNADLDAELKRIILQTQFNSPSP